MYGEIQNCFQQGRRSCPKPHGIELFVGWDKLPATALGFPRGEAGFFGNRHFGTDWQKRLMRGGERLKSPQQYVEW